MSKAKHGIVSITVVCVILGTIIGIQFKTVRSQITAQDIQRVSDLKIKLNNKITKNETQKQSLEEKEEKIEEY